MKRDVWLFVSTILIGLAVAPVVNLAPRLTSGGEGHPASPWWHPTTLYNLDFVSRAVGRLLFPLGLSTDPDQVVIGRNQWLFLGDLYAETRTTMRRFPSPGDLETGQRIRATAAAWDSWLRRRGVRLYRVVVVPNKGSIYPEYLPDWAMPPTRSVIDTVLQTAGGGTYIDLRPALLGARRRRPQLLYFPTDTHWNYVGAWEAFRALGAHLQLAVPTLRWPQEQDDVVIEIPRPGGDLARLLRMDEILADAELVPWAMGSLRQVTTRADFDSNAIIASGEDLPVVLPRSPWRVTSAQGLNDERVLWLYDSFGMRLTRFMAAAFRNMVELHWQDAYRDGGEELKRIVEVWQPDYVIVTVVERSARGTEFTEPPK